MEIAQTVVDTLKRGGNVLIPVSPVGSVYDLIDIVSRSIDGAGGSILETRIYFISPVAKGALAYSNVNAEWLAEARQNAVYVPEEPFVHMGTGTVQALRMFGLCTSLLFCIVQILYILASKEWKTEVVREYIRIFLQGVQDTLCSNLIFHAYSEYIECTTGIYWSPITTNWRRSTLTGNVGK
ncbi:unnamed protein product [Cylicostephanus goldi]|uniref:Uncharacterized protein n=1 Tax=Cylicostephanus goldi TaxID=71465 RepID=A0A3P6SC89_CYLGO|nr:unnamed protein product [Cylicostephanus goldi]